MKKSSLKLWKCLDLTKPIKIKKQKPRKRKKSQIHKKHQQDSADQESPKFGPRSDTSSADFDFKTELERLPFTINIGEAPLSREQQGRFHRPNLRLQGGLLSL